MKRKVSEMFGKFAVFSYNEAGHFWQQSSNWYYRKGYALRKLKEQEIQQ